MNKKIFNSLIFKMGLRLTFSLNFVSLVSITSIASASEYAAAKGKIDSLIELIYSEVGERGLMRLNGGVTLDPTYYNELTPPVVSLKEGVLNFGVNECRDKSEFENWSILVYPLIVDNSIENDAITPASNFRHILLKNAVVSNSAKDSKCFSHLNFNPDSIYKIIINKTINGSKAWEFEKFFSDKKKYTSLNKPRKPIKSVPTSALICNEPARLCYENSSKMNYKSQLSIYGPQPSSIDNKIPKEFFLKSRRTLKELRAIYPKFLIKTVTPTKSYIADFIAKNNDNTVIISVRDNAIGRLKEGDIVQLKEIGLDFSFLKIRGAHISILQPNKEPVNITENNGSVFLPFEVHNVKNVGRISSAGFSHGDNSFIEVLGRNASKNLRGINAVVIDNKGFVINSINFDTHRAAYRSEGIFKAQID